MVKISDPLFHDLMTNLVSKVSGDYAITGDIAAQAYLCEFFDHDLNRGAPFFREAQHVEILYKQGTKLPDEFGGLIKEIQSDSLGIFDSHYKSMISQRRNVSLSFQDQNVNLPLIPIEYIIAMKLCSSTTHDGWYARALVKTGKAQINSEMVRAILKSVNRGELFNEFLEMNYFL